MKKAQKRLGNKGFSLVELIVVIAIMAVLVGVLAPTLIKNVEKSRESTDMQNLDSIKNAVVTVMSEEKVNTDVMAAMSTNDSITYSLGKGKEAKFDSITTTSLKDALQETITSSIAMKSSNAKADTANVYIEIEKTGKVTVFVSTDNKIENAISCKNTKDSNGNAEKLIAQ